MKNSADKRRSKYSNLPEGSGFSRKRTFLDKSMDRKGTLTRIESPNFSRFERKRTHVGTPGVIRLERKKTHLDGGNMYRSISPKKTRNLRTMVRMATGKSTNIEIENKLSPKRRLSPQNFFQKGAKSKSKQRRNLKMMTMTRVQSTHEQKKGLLDLFGGKDNLRSFFDSLVGKKSSMK